MGMRTVAGKQCKRPALAIMQLLSANRLLHWHLKQSKCPAVSIDCSCKCW